MCCYLILSSIPILQELLHRTEQEDQARDSYLHHRLISRSNRGSSRHHTQGGSLQDLVEAVNNELDGDFLVGSQSKRLHQHSSRHKKYSSVSSRQREGGSLPSNVNVSTSYKEPFLNEFTKTQKSHKNERTIVLSGSGGGCGIARQDSQGSGCRDEATTGDSKKSHTVIEIDDDDADEMRHLLAHDSLAQVGLFIFLILNWLRCF